VTHLKLCKRRFPLCHVRLAHTQRCATRLTEQAAFQRTSLPALSPPSAVTAFLASSSLSFCSVSRLCQPGFQEHRFTLLCFPKCFRVQIPFKSEVALQFGTFPFSSLIRDSSHSPLALGSLMDVLLHLPNVAASCFSPLRLCIIGPNDNSASPRQTLLSFARLLGVTCPRFSLRRCACRRIRPLPAGRRCVRAGFLPSRH